MLDLALADAVPLAGLLSPGLAPGPRPSPDTAGPATCSSEIDGSVLIGFPAARSVLGYAAGATEIYLRSTPSHATAVQGVLAATANPAAACPGCALFGAGGGRPGAADRL